MVRAHGRGRTGIGLLDRFLRRAREAPETNAPRGDATRLAEIEAVLSELRPALLADGGDVAVEEVCEDGLVRLRFRGACAHCFQSPLTAEGMLAPRVRQLPWVRDVAFVR